MPGVLGSIGIVAPQDFFARGDHGNILHPGKKNIAVGKHPNVVKLGAGTGGIGPDHLAILDEEHFVVVFPDVQHRMLREAVAG